MKQNYLFRRAIVFGVLQIFACYLLYAQQGFSAYDIATKSSSFYPVSVTASQLFRKPPEQMDYSHGRATIRIPIYEIHADGFTLPISLYYTTGGIRANQKNGPIGIGWQLEAEPMITRIIRGKPDEALYLEDGKQLEENSEFFRLRIATGNADIQQDVFNYRLLSGSGKFFLRPSHNMSFDPVILSRDDVRVESESKIRTNFANPIFITDTSGNRYTFGADEQSRERTRQSGTGEGVTAWKASEITSPDGGRITFSYDSGSKVEQHSMRYDFYMVEDMFPTNMNTPSNVPPHPGYWKGINGKMNYYYLDGYETHPNGVSVPVIKQWLNVQNKPYDQPGSSVQPRPISSIGFKGGSVDFIYNSSNSLLKEIRVYCGGNLQKRVTLSARQSLDPNRYFLDEVRIYDSTGHGTGRYQFDYYPGVYYPDGRYGIDYWGYYSNGSYTDMVPMELVSVVDNPNNPPVDIPIGGASGAGSLNGSLAFALRQVTWPSGGTTKYEYESHQVHTPGSTLDSPSSVCAGGVRLASVTDSPKVGKDVVRKFKYGSSAKLNGIGYSAFPVCAQTFAQVTDKHYLVGGGMGQLTSYSGRCRTYSNQNFVTSDCDIYYPCVCEEIDDVRTMHYFPNSFTTVCGQEARYPQPIGYESILSHEDSCVYLRNRIPIETQRVHLRPSSSRDVVEVKPLAIFDNILDPSSISGNVKALFLNSYSKRPVTVYHQDDGMGEIITKKFDKKTFFTQRQKWDYGPLTSRQLLNIESDNEKVEFSYPGDSPSKAAHALMIQRNETATPVETRHYVDGALRKRICYDYVVDTCTNRGYRLSSISESTSNDGSTLRIAESYGEYLPCGKPSEVTSQDGRTICLVWANEGDWLIAAIEGMTAAQVRSAGIDLKDISRLIVVPYNIYEALDELRASHPEAHINTYQYQPTGEVSAKRGPDGVAEHYIYDGSGRLSEIKDNQLNTISKYEYHEANQ